MTATDTTTRARELAQQLSNAVRAERKAALEWGGLSVSPGSAFVDVHGETIADALTALSDENAKLRERMARVEAEMENVAAQLVDAESKAHGLLQENVSINKLATFWREACERSDAACKRLIDENAKLRALAAAWRDFYDTINDDTLKGDDELLAWGRKRDAAIAQIQALETSVQ